MLFLALLGGLLIALAVWIHRSGRDRKREIGFGAAGAVLVVIFFGSLFVSSDAGADGEDEEAVENTGPADVGDDFDACPDGVAADDPTFYVRGDDVSHPRAVMPALPKGDPAGVVDAIFGSDGYACMDPLAAVAMAQVQEGILPFTEREDQDELNDWVKLLASNGEQWNSIVDETVKRFDGMTWEEDWQPDDGDAMFLVADAADDAEFPSLFQVEDATASGIGVFRFAKNYGDAMLPKDLVMTQEQGWLALPEGQFARVPVMEQLDEPLFAEDDQEQQDQGQADQDESQSQDEDESGSSGTKATNQSNANDGGGGNATGGGQNSGTSGGKGGGSGSGCGDSGCGTGGGSGGGGGDDCGSSCPGSGGGGDGGECPGCGPSTTQPKPTTTTTRPPTTTTQPPTTTTRPPTTTTQPPTTTTRPPQKDNPSTTTTTQPCDPSRYFC